MTAVERTFPCATCGASLVYAPGTTALRCTHCGNETKLPSRAEDVVEHDLSAVIAEQAAQLPVMTQQTLPCPGCGASVSFPPGQASLPCPWCGSALAAETVVTATTRPHALLPFAIERPQAEDALRRWLQSRWFAPAKMQSLSGAHTLQAVWMPAWTFDADTVTWYEGERGDDYTVQVPYQTVEKGQTVTRIRTETRTRWSSASGVVNRFFDDVLVPATKDLPANLAASLEPWPLKQLVPFDAGFLAGTATGSIAFEAADGFAKAKLVMEEVIRADVRRDIGGDRQRIRSFRTEHRRPTCKRILLPVWSAGYRLDERTYTVLVNATTGEVQGERPWSVIKITLTVLAVAAVITTLVLLLR